MIYPIVAYGDTVLRKMCQDIQPQWAELPQVIENMFETMYEASGVGLAAPQVGLNLRLFVVDGRGFNEDVAPDSEDFDPSVVDFKKVFVNPEIIDEDGDEWGFEEGCLSIPGIRAEVFRPEYVTVRYFDEHWNEHTHTFEGMAARIIQHEYDHIEGVLFTDHLTGLKKRLLKNKLSDISKGKVDVDYRMRFPK